MKITFLGDSITQGVGASSSENAYVNVVGKLLGCQVANLGVSGTRIARQDQGNYLEDFNARALKIEQDSDFVVVFGGTNDFGHGIVPLGQEGDNSNYTFYGALTNLIEYLLSLFDKRQIVFVLPLKRFDMNNPKPEEYSNCKGLILADYVNVMKSILTKYDICYLNMFDGGLPMPVNGEYSTSFLDQDKPRYFTDGLHPNDLGHYALALAVASYIEGAIWHNKK